MRYSELIDASIEDYLREMVYLVGRNKKTCLRGMVDGERPMSQLRGIFTPPGQRKGEKFGRQELLGFQR